MMLRCTQRKSGKMIPQERTHGGFCKQWRCVVAALWHWLPERLSGTALHFIELPKNCHSDKEGMSWSSATSATDTSRTLAATLTRSSSWTSSWKTDSLAKTWHILGIARILAWCFHGNNSMLSGDHNFGNTVSTSFIHHSTSFHIPCHSVRMRHFPQGWATTYSTGPKDTRSSGSGEQSPFERWECYCWVLYGANLFW